MNEQNKMMIMPVKWKIKLLKFINKNQITFNENYKNLKDGHVWNRKINEGLISSSIPFSLLEREFDH